MLKNLLWYHLIFLSFAVSCQNKPAQNIHQINSLITGAENTNAYLPLLEGKSVGIVANHTSYVNEVHLLDYLLDNKVKVTKIFAPEHGFRGKADAGELVDDERDAKTNLPIASLYGKNKKPSTEALNGIDIMIFDIQDVGVRFYTYISTMTYIMEACAENGIPLLVFDRPNPHAHYTDGPMMEEEYMSFIGMHKVPVVYGMTIGEYAKMVVGESWLSAKGLDLTVVPCLNYNREERFELPIKPSPNLPTPLTIQVYPSTCFFEGTTFSEGRGTDAPFLHYGHTAYRNKSFSFTPVANDGSKYPKFKDKLIYGKALTDLDIDEVHKNARLDLSYLIDAFANMDNAVDDFFLDNNFFEKLAGTSELRRQILEKKSMEEIRESWSDGLIQFEFIRSKYLIY